MHDTWRAVRSSGCAVFVIHARISLQIGGRGQLPSRVRRNLLKNVSRIVVKLGTGLLTNHRNGLNRARMTALVGQLARLREAGREVVVVSSGAVGAGMGGLNFAKRPTRLAELKACAAVGQLRLMATYERLFAKHDQQVAQVLLTHEDLRHKERHLNARDTLNELLFRGVIPIVNENDAVSYTELKFGDNDRLSALVASLLPADLLVILTTVEGVIEDFGGENPRVVRTIERIDEHISRNAKGTMSDTATGGMSAKIEAAKIAMRSGIPLVIADGREPDILDAAVGGGQVGTVFLPDTHKLRSRKRWIAFFHHPRGAILVDDGAVAALRDNGKSLLRPGIVTVEGAFKQGDVVRVCDRLGTEFARGIAGCDSDSLRSPEASRGAVVHRDNLVIL